MEHGYAAMTVDDVAQHAGVSRRTVFNHFDSKADMLLLGPIIPSNAALESFINSPGPLVSDLRALMIDCAATIDDQRDHFLMLRTIMQSNPELKTHIHARVVKFAGLINDAAFQRLTHQDGHTPDCRDPRIMVITHLAGMIQRSAMDVWVGEEATCTAWSDSEASPSALPTPSSFIEAVSIVCDSLDALLDTSGGATLSKAHVTERDDQPTAENREKTTIDQTNIQVNAGKETE